jgi:translation elongation factor EF-4
VAKEKGLKIIPVLNKVLILLSPNGRLRLPRKQIDLPASQPERVAAQIESTFGIDPSEVLQISAKTGHGVDLLLAAIVERMPSPKGSPVAPLKAFLFDSSCAF